MKQAFVGNALGEFGHMIPLVMPVLNAIKAKGYDLKFCGFKGHDIYLDRQIGGSPIDTFYGIDWWPEPRAGFISKHEPKNALDILALNKNIYYWPMSIMSHQDNYKFYCLHNKIVKRLVAPQISKYRNSIVIYPRCKTNSNYVSIEFWKYLIDRLFEKYTIYMAGISQETISGLDNQNCFYIHQMPNMIDAHIDILNNCAATICSVGGGVFLSVACGTPTLVIGPSVFSNIADKSYPFHNLQFNPLGTVMEYLVNSDINIMFLAAQDFLNRSSNDRSCVKDVVEIGPVELYKLHH